MRHIDEFAIYRFRGLRDLKLADLGQINLLVGDNNSGKTSVLEALSIFCDPLNTRKWRDAVTTREVLAGQLRPNINDLLIWLFPQGEESTGGISSGDFGLSLSALGSTPLKKVSAYYERFSEIVRMKYSTVEEPVIEDRDVEVEGIRVHISVEMRNIQQTLFDTDNSLKETLVFADYPLSSIASKKVIPVIPTQIVSPFSYRLSGLPLRLWSDVVEANLKSETIELLQFFDPDIQEIDIISPTERRPIVSVKHKRLGRAPLSTFGDGLRRVFTLATTIPQVKNGLMLVDELETAIHTRALERTFGWLIKACVQNNVQLFATTHSIEALDTVIEVSRESVDLVGYRLQKGKERITITRFEKELLTLLREELGVEVR